MLPTNPPRGGYVGAATLTFEDDLATNYGFWFWTYPGRTWAAGPYRTKRDARAARDRYLKLVDGPALRSWEV